LTYLHDLNIVHGDINPKNVVTVQDCVKVIDFGAARRTGQEIDFSTINYTPPECWNHNEKVHPAQDIWALGMLVTGQMATTLVYKGMSESIIMRRFKLACDNQDPEQKTWDPRYEPFPPELKMVEHEELTEFIKLCCSPKMCRPSARQLDKNTFLDDSNKFWLHLLDMLHSL